MARAFRAAQPSGIDISYTNVRGPWSFVAWVRPLSFPSRKVFQQGDDNATGPPFAEWGFMFDQVTNPFAKLFVETSDGTFSSAVADVSAWTVGTWHLVVGTWDESQLKLYLDGSLVATQATNAIIATSHNQNASLGYSPIYGFNWDGDLAEVAIFSHASTSAVLTASEVATLWNSGTGGYVSSLLPSRTDLLYNWRLDSDDAAAGPVVDRVSGNNGMYATGSTIQLVPHPFGQPVVHIVGDPSYATQENVSSIQVTRNGVTTGNGLLIFIENYSADITSIVDDKSDVFVENTGARITDGSGAHYQQFFVQSAVGGNTVITVSVPSGSYPSVVVVEIAGHDATAMPTAHAASGSGTSEDSGALSISARSLLLGFTGAAVGYDGGYTPAQGWTELLDVKPATYHSYQAQYSVADAGTYSSQETSTSSINWGAMIAAIAAVASAAYTLTADGAGVTVTGGAATLRVGQRVIASPQSVTVTGNNAVLTTARRLSAASASTTLTGFAASLQYSSQTHVLQADTGAVIVTASPAALRRTCVLQASGAALSTTGADATLYTSAADAFIGRTRVIGKYEPRRQVTGVVASRVVLTGVVSSRSSIIIGHTPR